jgi:hypothetical protein
MITYYDVCKASKTAKHYISIIKLTEFWKQSMGGKSSHTESCSKVAK